MSEHILIIEDDLDIANIERDYLMVAGYDVTIMTNGTEGIEAALNTPVDLIILDVMLPEMDGFEVCRQIRDKVRVPIVMVTARLDDIDKIRGLSYEEIAKRGGGILNSCERIRKASEEELFDAAYDRIQEIAGFGTGAVEIKSGYGLDTESELKMLRVIRRLKAETPLLIKSTFLGAHAVPLEYKGRQTEYVDLIINEMIPMVAAEELADYIDVFCDKGFFTVEDTDRMLNAGMKYGLRAKIHANELDYSGGVQVGVKYNAISVDHLECMGEEEIACLLESETMPTVLPGAAFFLNMPYSPVRKMIQAGLPVALASDYNPGSSPSGNMKFIMSLGCINYKMLPEEVINATTLNSAYAMGVEEEAGSIAVGKLANFYITTPISGIEYLPYAYTADLIEAIFLKGEQY